MLSRRPLPFHNFLSVLLLAVLVLSTGCQFDGTFGPTEPENGLFSDSSRPFQRSHEIGKFARQLERKLGNPGMFPAELNEESSAAGPEIAACRPTGRPIDDETSISSAKIVQTGWDLTLPDEAEIEQSESPESLELAGAESSLTVLPRRAELQIIDNRQDSGEESPDDEYDETIGEDTESANRFPIDLPSVLRLAGADNWNVILATERVREAQARLDAAKALWLPSLNAGIGYTKHDGQLQSTNGPVLDISRNSLFVGGGAVIGSFPNAGGGGGPARMAVDLSLTDAIFEPLAARQLVQAEEARESAAFNDTLMQASLAYYDLVAAQAQRGLAGQNLENAVEVLKLTDAFVRAGKGAKADSARIRVESSARQQDVVQAEMQVKVASTELVRILQMDHNALNRDRPLVALDDRPVPVELVDESSDLSALIKQGQSTRPEVVAGHAELESNRHRLRAEKWRPYIPTLHVGASAGGFGGGVNDNLNQLDSRGDFDVLAVWQVDNLGLGTRAAQREQNSRFRQTLYNNHKLQDQVAAEVASAYHQVQAQRRRIEIAEQSVDEAIESYRQNIARIRGLEGFPLEALQAVKALAAARQFYLDAIVAYNRAQVRLLRAIGRSPEMTTGPA